MYIRTILFYVLLPFSIVSNSFSSDDLTYFDLPHEVRLHIFSFCEYQDVTTFGSTCSQARASSMDYLYDQVMHSKSNPHDSSVLISILNHNTDILKREERFPVVVNNNSAFKKILSSAAQKNALTVRSLTCALQEEEDLYKGIYERLFNTALFPEDTEGQLRNKSILQHLTSSFSVFSRNDPSLKESESSFTQELHKLKLLRTYLSIQEVLENSNIITDNTFITVTDSELSDPNSKTKLLTLLDEKKDLILLLDVGKYFVDPDGTLTIKTADLPKNLTRLTLTNATQNAQRIGDNFLYGAKSLTHFDTASLNNVTSIGKFFLMYAMSLRHFDTAGLSSVTSIGKFFLYNVRSLTHFDTAGLINVTSIGHNFLYDARSLTHFDTAGLINVTSIGDNFLYNARSLTHFDTADLSSVTSIGTGFLSDAKRLTQFDTAGLINVASIGDDFLSDAKRLTQFDTTGLSSVTSIENGFLMRARSLTHFDTAGLSSVTSIGKCFLWGAKRLTQFDTTGLINVTSIGDDFLKSTSIKNYDALREEILRRKNC
jgi:hypothetical protein